MHRIDITKLLVALIVSALLSAATCARAGEQSPWVVYEGGDGPGQDKHIVFVTGDEEYRSEESMPQMAKILAEHHGFKCTVLFAINGETGEIDPQTLDNIPGLHKLKTADLMVIFTRFRDLPDEQMEHIVEYVNSGKPILGVRTATHAFRFREHDAYDQYSWRSNEWKGGFGRQVLGETWVAHYGKHQRESTRGIIPDDMQDHPLVKGIESIWGPSDVYDLTTLHGDCKPVVLGQPLQGMQPDDPPNTDKKPLPVAWIKTYTGKEGKTARVFTMTMGHGGDFKNEGVRRLFVNACYWCLGMEDKVPAESKVDLVGEYDPNPIGVGGHKKGLKPSDHELN